MEGGKRTPLSVRKKPKRTNTRLIRSIVAYLQSDSYLFAPLFSKFSPQMQMPPPPSSFISSKADVKVVKKNKKRLSEKVKEYLNSECHMYRPMISLPKPGTSLQGNCELQAWLRWKYQRVVQSRGKITTTIGISGHQTLQNTPSIASTIHLRWTTKPWSDRSFTSLFHSTRGKDGEARSKESSN